LRVIEEGVPMSHRMLVTLCAASQTCGASDVQQTNLLDTDHTLEDDLGFRVPCGVHNSRAVDEVDPLHECDVLPHLGLSGDRRCLAHLLRPKRIDD
jgi:hypothetical protein